jgi:mannose-6-phosphate isomerase-like protein (cupin superfamily)
MEQEVQIFKYEKPDFHGEKKGVFVCKSDILKAGIQVVNKGGENNLHTHTGDDAFWWVIGGAVRFYGEGDKVIAELSQNQGIMIPRGYKYWFESASDEPLEILRVVAHDQSIQNKRVNFQPLKPWMVGRVAQ